LNPGDPVEITVPVVYYTGTDLADDDPILAGGNFWWVKEGLGGDDTKGHNVFPGEGDDNLNSAPYGAGCNYGTFCHANLHTEDTSGLAGPRQGCLKCHMMKTSGAWPAPQRVSIMLTTHWILWWAVIQLILTAISASSQDTWREMVMVFVGLRMTTGRLLPAPATIMSILAFPELKMPREASLSWATP
jgi:hypothetical protein